MITDAQKHQLKLTWKQNPSDIGIEPVSKNCPACWKGQGVCCDQCMGTGYDPNVAYVCTCQACDQTFMSEHVMFVADEGDYCLICVSNLVKMALGSLP